MFDIYQADSSIEASQKMVQNLRLHEFQIPFWTAYIEERRLDLHSKYFEKLNPLPNNSHSGKIMNIFVNISVKILKYIKVLRIVV